MAAIQLNSDAYKRLEGSKKPVHIEWSEIVDPTKSMVGQIRSKVSAVLMNGIATNADYSFVPEVSRAKSTSKSAIVATVTNKNAKGITVWKKASSTGTGVLIEERRILRRSR